MNSPEQVSGVVSGYGVGADPAGRLGRAGCSCAVSRLSGMGSNGHFVCDERTTRRPAICSADYFEGQRTGSSSNAPAETESASDRLRGDVAGQVFPKADTSSMEARFD